MSNKNINVFHIFNYLVYIILNYKKDYFYFAK